jgi:hypothetical protein
MLPTKFQFFRLLTDFVCLYNYEFWLSLCKIVRSSVILLLPLFINLAKGFQRRRLKCEKLTDNGRQVMAKAHIAFGKVS